MTVATSANEPTGRRRLSVALLVAIIYPVVGITFAILDARSATASIRIWRLTAWLVSGAAFAAHFTYEHRRLRSSPLRTALDVSLAVALGAFVLAIWVNLHALQVATRPRSPLAPLALILFPLVTGTPAFVIALATAGVAGRLRLRRR